ncbi:hypothetical protein CSA56_05005 [candidate division KSB3 bacterium]|uniref:Glycosyl transferase family 1 n=1 Tax=candidate division KSB3 bacterium TaxID=2044937 RepID=A0A2G6KHV9_9BACT|nr:MAG: hypothetical protein CSA56_05005 [candidate division KSB3 bacterium]
MKVLIVTKSFVREVSDFVQYAASVDPSYQFSLVMPTCPEELPAAVSTPPLGFPDVMRASLYLSPLLRQFKTFKPDIVHVFEEFSGLIALQCTLFHELWCRKSKLMVYSAENLRHNTRPILRMPMNYVMTKADLAFVCSQGVKEVLVEEGFPHPVEVVPLGVDISLFRKSSAVDLKDELQLDQTFVLGYVGRLLEIKGIFLLLDVLKKLPEHVHLLMVGTGPEEDNLRKRAADFGIFHRIHLVGNVPHADLPRYMNCMDAGVVPSQTTPRWKEQFGRVAIELMSCEVPVIASDSGSLPEVLGDAGLIFPEDNVQALHTHIQSLMSSPQGILRLGRYGRERVRQHYSTTLMYNTFFAMYERLTSSHPHPSRRSR